MPENRNLADAYIKYVDNAPEGSTVDDFFDHVDIPMEQRTDFAFAAIMKQVSDKTKGVC